MLQVKNISKQFNDHKVLDGIDLNLSDSERIGLIGDNGSGKTTLMRIIKSELNPDNGQVDITASSIGYLQQELTSNAKTVIEYLGAAEHQVLQALHNVGMDEIDVNQVMDSLSGGQKTRLGLAKILLDKPDALLLDEPTNNLDLEGLKWLEDFLASFKGPVLFTSHDRAFLNKVTTDIAELKDGKIKRFGGNYDFYKKQIETKKESLLEDFKSQEKYRKRIEEDIRITKQQALGQEIGTKNDHYRRLSKKVAKKAKSRQRRLEKQMASEDWVERPEERDSYKHKFGGGVHNKKLVLSCTALSKGFSKQKLFNNLSFEITGNQHIWLKGKNGSGKSTLLKIIVGLEAIDSGEVSLGEGVNIGYFTQEVSQLDLKLTGAEELAKLNIGKTEAMREANRLHIEPQLMLKPLKKLSRGQRTKIEFMKLILAENDLLLLDEPTNHLEIETREEIEAALQNYQGAILVASHDRYFLAAIGIDRTIDLDRFTS